MTRRRRRPIREPDWWQARRLVAGVRQAGFQPVTCRGNAPDPRHDISARHVHGRGATGAGSPDGARGPRGHPTVQPSRPRLQPRFLGSIIRREAVEFLRRKPEAGGTPTPLGVEFVRYSGSYGLGFRQTAPKTPRMAVRAVFPDFREHGLPSRPRTHARTDPQARGGHGQALGWRSAEDHVAGSSATAGLRSVVAPRDCQRGNGGDALVRAIHGSAGLFGVEGAEPLASRSVQHCVCWLRCHCPLTPDKRRTVGASPSASCGITDYVPGKSP